MLSSDWRSSDWPSFKNCRILSACIITNSSYYATPEALIKVLKWPTVKNIIRNEAATIGFKSINDLAPYFLSHLFNRNSDCNIMNLRNAETDLLVPFM